KRPPVRYRRRIVVRHVRDHRVVALIEIVSPANKDRKSNVRDLADKIVQALEAGVQVLMLDLLPPTRHDPGGIHGAVWAYFDATPYQPPENFPLTLVSYVWQEDEPEAHLEPTAVGRTQPDMPLFLNHERYVNVPLEDTYMAAYGGMPAYWREVIEGARSHNGK